MSIYQTIQDFITLGLENGAIESLDELYVRNQLLHFLGLTDWDDEVDKTAHESDALVLMDQLLELADQNGVIPEGGAEFYESALMDFITPRPSRVNHDFWGNYLISPDKATQYFYTLAKQVNQVKTRDIARNIAFNHATKYGELEITINLSKPEKDPKAIAAAKLVKNSSYPACQLCMENEGFYGIGNKPARSNHRIIQLDINGEHWGFQYSPYAYFNEHSILLNSKHQPMAINKRAFDNLLGFLDKFPNYMIGSNADLPIVGGSILTHDHYQAGRHEFPMAKAEIRENVELSEFPEVSAGIVNWPMSVLRLSSSNQAELSQAADVVLKKWQVYSDESLQITAKTNDGVLHHTITPIARKRDGKYEMDLVLRDNNVSKAFPDGIFHPHAELHHIKKENIGLIEVMGLAILPARLKDELAEVEKYLLNQENDINEIHKAWADELKAKGDFDQANVHEKVQHAVGHVFEKVLQDAGVFKDDSRGQEGFRKFIDFVNHK